MKTENILHFFYFFYIFYSIYFIFSFFYLEDHFQQNKTKRINLVRGMIHLN